MGGQGKTINGSGVRMIYTIAYPSLTVSDKTFIDGFRRRHDARNCEVVAAHFTIVFGCTEVETQAYVRHVKEMAALAEPVSFRCRYAMVGVNSDDASAHVFLVPDEGFSGISRLHDRLYTGVLADHLKLGVPYIPHITIATVIAREEAKRLCEELNENRLSIVGKLDSLTVGKLDNNRIVNLASFGLGS
jgi:2'-5' RNA ligase